MCVHVFVCVEVSQLIVSHGDSMYVCSMYVCMYVRMYIMLQDCKYISCSVALLSHTVHCAVEPNCQLSSTATRFLQGPLHGIPCMH